MNDKNLTIPDLGLKGGRIGEGGEGRFVQRVKRTKCAIKLEEEKKTNTFIVSNNHVQSFKGLKVVFDKRK